MESLQLNTVLGWVLGACLFAMGLMIISENIYHVDHPETPGYIIEVAEGPAAAAEEPAVEPISVRLASADIGDGEKVFKKCVACHTIEDGGANKVGPALWNVVNRAIGTVSGFGYSGALTDFAGDQVWDYEHLDAFLENPKKYISGTSMGFAGLKKPGDRADVIAYLRAASNDPAPLPEAPAAEETAEEAPAGE